MLTLRQVNLGLDSRLNGATFAVITPSNLQEDDFVDSGKKLREVFDTFKETIVNLGITEDIFDVTSLATDDPEEISYYVMFKNRDCGKKLYCDGQAALFIVEIDSNARNVSIRYGFGGCGAGKTPCINKSEVMKNSDSFVKVPKLQEEFKNFLDLVLPEVIEWDKAYADGVLKQTRDGDKLPPWLAVRIVQNHEGDTIDFGEGEWNKRDLCGTLSDGQAHLVKSGDAGLTVG